MEPAKRVDQGSPWSDPEWRQEATAWFRQEAARQGRALIGPIEQPHIRPWSTVLRARAPEGWLYMKAAAPALRYEVPLILHLHRWRPDILPDVLAADPHRGWLLMGQRGERLREVLRGALDLQHWRRLLPAYAELQMAAATAADDLLALGLPDRRPANLPFRLKALLADDTALAVGREEGLTEDQRVELQAILGSLADDASSLAAMAVPPSLDHGDLHDGNVFVAGERHAVIDWGDASVAHPFFSLRTAFASIETTFDLPEDSPIFQELRDIYLGPWLAVAPREELLAAFHWAQRFWALGSALRWHRALRDLEEAARAPYRHAIPSLLAELLAANRGG